MKCLIDDLGLVAGEGLTIIYDQHMGIIEAAKEVMPLAEHRQRARHIYANFRNKFTRSIAFFTTDKGCDVVENRISKCYNALIVDARRKPIINMLEDIRVSLMERMQRIREKHVKWNDVLCPNIRKKFEILKDLHRHWKIIPSGESRFEVRNGFEGFKVDERLRTYTCRAWQLSGIPCQHALAVIYFLHRDPEEYVSNWYKKDMFVAAYNHYIEGMNCMGQWPTTQYQKPLPPIKRRMPGRPPQKKRWMEGHNKRGCHASPTQNTIPTPTDNATPAQNTTPNENTTSGGSASGSAKEGGSTRGGSARGGSTRGGSARGGSTRGGSARGGSANGGSTMGGSASFSTPTKEVSASYRTPTRDGSTSYKTPTRDGSLGVEEMDQNLLLPNGIEPIGFGVSWDPIDGEQCWAVHQNVQGISVPTWPYKGTPADLLTQNQADEIPNTSSQPMLIFDKEEEPSDKEEGVRKDQANSFQETTTTWSRHPNVTIPLRCPDFWGCYTNPELPKLKLFSTPELTLSREEFKAQLIEMERLEKLKAEQEKSERGIKKLFNPATLKARAQKWKDHEPKKTKSIEEINQLISFRVDPLPITKISYIVNKNKEPTMRITRDNDPLNLVVLQNFRLRSLGFSEWPEVFVTENVVADGCKRNITPPVGVEGKNGKVIREPEAGFFYYNGNFDLVYQRESEFHITSTVQLIRLQRRIVRDSPEADEMYQLMNLEIESRNDVIKARETVEKNLDGL
ncbi:transposase, MuDR, plant, partial [Tanacetum coccineum]